MWPPQSVKTWLTPAWRNVRATRCPPVRSAIATSAAPSARPEAREDLAGDRLELGALVPRVADRAHEEVVAAGGAERFELLRALLGRTDDAVAPRERLEVLRVALAENAHPRAFRGFEVASHGDEDKVGSREAAERPAGVGGRGTNLVEALRVAVGLHHVGDPPVALAAGPLQRRVGAPADPDRRRLLDGLGIDRDRLEAREPAVEARRRVAPQGPDHVDALVHARAALLVGYAAELEFLWILAADTDAEDEAASREHVEGGRRLRGHRRRAERQQIDGD